MDYRIRRFLISAAVIFIAALLFLWAMHWMGKGINRVNSHPVERSFQGVFTVAPEQQPCGVQVVERVGLVASSFQFFTRLAAVFAE